MTVKTAIIGLGIMGRRMLEHMQPHPGYRIVSLWDPDPAACRAALAMVPEAWIAPSAEGAMAEADLVYLACPPVPRKAYALAAAETGKAVFLEKPLGVDIGESEALVAGLKAAGVPAAVNFTQAAGEALAGVVQASEQGTLGEVLGADIVVTYAHWPRAWQKAADWLRFRDEGGMTREVVSHFLFFAERVVGPLTVKWACPSYPSDPALCETHLLARLETADRQIVSIFAGVGGAQPDRQELTIKGSFASRRITDFHIVSHSDGGEYLETGPRPTDPRAVSLRVQLDQLLLCLAHQPHRLATIEEALRVQKLVEAMLSGGGKSG